MASELFSKMETIDALAPGLPFVKQQWEESYKSRPIVTGFMRDRGLGDKRLISMADRTTNCIDTVAGLACRPTITNNYEHSLTNLDVWWPQWLSFVFDTELVTKAGAPPQRVFTRFKEIKKASYPAIEEEEAEHSVALQTLCLAIFDAIMVHMMNVLQPGVWEEIKQALYQGLSANKVPNCLEILATKYTTTDVILLQECSIAFLQALETHPLASKYTVVSPAKFDESKNQNSLILLSKEVFASDTVTEVTAAIVDGAAGADSVAGGDMLAVTCFDKQGGKYLVASYHGDTSGMATTPVVTMVTTALTNSYPDCSLLFGMDANTYGTPEKKKLFVQDFLTNSAEQGLYSTWGDDISTFPNTVMNARTFCQTQLNKAVRRADFIPGNKAIDCSPKDHFLFNPTQFKLSDVAIDNTGNGLTTTAQHDRALIMPGMNFPSDHAIIGCTLETLP